MTKNPEKTKQIKEKAQRRITSRLEQGRGSGSGRAYKPFIHVRDIASKGRSHRIPSVTVGRVHQLLSDLELHILLQLDWHEHVVDIREQFPIPFETSQAIANEMAIAHPSYQGTDEIVTTDFLIDLDYGGKISRRALSAKYVDALDDPRVLEKLELERRYWLSKDIPFYLVTEAEIPELLKKNVHWFHPYISHFELSSVEQHEYFNLFLTAFNKYPSQKLTELTTKLDDEYNVQAGDHLAMMRHLFAQRAFHFDLEKLTIKNLRARDITPSQHWLEETYEYAVGE